MTAGYSKTPLLKKLGIKSGYMVWLVATPDGYRHWLGTLPADVAVVDDTVVPEPASCDFIHYFSTSRAEMAAKLPLLKAALAVDGMLWLSWPKKAANVPTDLDGNVVRELGLTTGLVDVKVAAVSEVWSGLKFVYRLEDR